MVRFLVTYAANAPSIRLRLANLTVGDMNNDDWQAAKKHLPNWQAAKKHLPKALYLRQWTIKQASHTIPLDTMETVLRRNGSLLGVHLTSQIPWVKCATLTLCM
jgi:hypothetical protein